MMIVGFFPASLTQHTPSGYNHGCQVTFYE